MTQKKRALLICTGNSCRSQMAEGVVRHLFSDHCDVYSAGIVSTFVHPVVKELMAEIEMPLEGHVSNCVDEYLNDPFDVVITLCDKAKKHCPPFPHCDHHVHWPFRDPITFAGQHKDVLKGFRDVRDLIVTQFNDCFLDELK